MVILALFVILIYYNLQLKKAKELNLKINVGNILSTDVFYNPDNYDKWTKLGVLAVEMESAALYINAGKFGKKALAMFTISDKIYNNESCTPEERQTAFTDMMELALNVGINC